MTSASEIVARTDRLPAMPAVYYRVKQSIDDPKGSIAKVAEAMMTDPAMTARVLRIVNSPYYGYPGRIETVSRALNILGMQHVHDLVLAWAISTTLAGVRPALLSIEAFWRGSVARAVTARHLARQAHFVDTERLFVEGLISDIGHLFLYLQVPDLAWQALQHSQRTGRALHEAERDLIGCDSAEIGAEVVRAWNLPEPFAEPIRFQVSPARAVEHRIEATILHVAAGVAEQLAGARLSQVDTDALEMLGLDRAGLAALTEQLRPQIGGVLATFFPHLAAA